MPNIGLETTKMDGLWNEELFWAILPEDRSTITQRLRKERITQITIDNSDLLTALRRSVHEQRLKEIFRENYLVAPESFPPIYCSMRMDEPNSITTMRTYSPDTRLSTALSLIFPSRELTCTWFIDGLGDYGSYKLIGGMVREKCEANVND